MKQRKLNLWTPAKSHQNLQYWFKNLQFDIIKDNQKKLKTEIKKLIEQKYKINNRIEWQRKMSRGYINSNWSLIYDDDVRDLTANTMSEVCKDSEIEPELTLLSREKL